MQFGSHAIESRSGRQAAQTAGAPQVQILAGDPSSAGHLGITDGVGVLVSINEIDQARGLHSHEYSPTLSMSSSSSGRSRQVLLYITSGYRPWCTCHRWVGIQPTAFWQRLTFAGCSCVVRDRKSTRLNSSHVSISYAVI